MIKKPETVNEIKALKHVLNITNYYQNNISNYKPAEKCKSNPSQEYFKMMMIFIVSI